jgi:hypothetical protein
MDVGTGGLKRKRGLRVGRAGRSMSRWSAVHVGLRISWWYQLRNYIILRCLSGKVGTGKLEESMRNAKQEKTAYKTSYK